MRAFFVDTVHRIAAIRPDDQWHATAVEARSRLGEAELDRHFEQEGFSVLMRTPSAPKRSRTP